MIEEKKTVYEKKLRMAEVRKRMKNDNFKYDCYRSRFYRNLEGEENKINKEKIETQKVVEYWKNVWKKEDNDEESQHQDIIELVKEGRNEIDTSEEKIKESIRKEIMKISNWKAPGPDGVFNFTIKKAKVYHGKTTESIWKAINNPNKIDDSLYTGNTYLLPRSQKN